MRVTGCEFRVTCYEVESIVLVVVLVLVIDKAEYTFKIRWGDEYEDEDEYESLTGYRVPVFSVIKLYLEHSTQIDSHKTRVILDRKVKLCIKSIF